MSKLFMAEAQTANREQTLAGGSFYGAVQRKVEMYQAIFTELRHTSARKLPAHAHELPFFGLLLAGSYGETYCRQQKQFASFTIMFRPAGVPHQDEIGPEGVRFFEIEVRSDWGRRIADCSGNLNFACDDCEGGELTWLGMKLFRETRGPMPANDLCIQSLLSEMLALVARMPGETVRDSPRWMARITERLRSDYCDRLTLDQLSKDAGVHPVHLSRMFRKCTGEGIGDYVHRLRIRKACEQMLEPESTLADIGLATGFADQSHFTRAFRKVTGTSPNVFRRLVLAGAGIRTY